MSYLINNEQKMNEIIFADRNKAYGAYAIRSAYGNTIFKSLSFMILGIGSMVSTAFYFSNRNNPKPDQSSDFVMHDSVYVIPVSLKKEEPAAPAAPSEPEHTTEKTKKPEITSIRIVDSTFTAAPTLTAETSVTSTNTAVTDAPGTGIASKGTGTNTTITDDGLDGTDTAKVKEPFAVDTPPEFEGGLKALYRFISSNLKYPNLASIDGREGTVYVKFIVDENGKVGNLKLLNTVGYGMDDEALRVVSIIPKFKSPAKVKGKPVKTYYQLPIRFRFTY